MLMWWLYISKFTNKLSNHIFDQFIMKYCNPNDATDVYELGFCKGFDPIYFHVIWSIKLASIENIFHISKSKYENS